MRPRTDEQIKAEINRPDFKFARIQSQDIDKPRLAAEARAKQPGLIVVDRDVPGPYQNYPPTEARVPPQPLPYPWEEFCGVRGEHYRGEASISAHNSPRCPNTAIPACMSKNCPGASGRSKV